MMSVAPHRPCRIAGGKSDNDATKRCARQPAVRQRRRPDAENASGGEASLASFSLVARLGQQFVIDNRPGGGGNIGTEEGNLPDKLILKGDGRTSIPYEALDV